MKEIILLIDDDIEILNVLQMGLEDSGFAVRIAANTETAAQLLTQEKISLVVCDLNLANESGIDFLQRMRTTLSPVPPFIICSGFPVGRHQLQENGIAGFMSKPFTIPELIKLLKQFLTD